MKNKSLLGLLVPLLSLYIIACQSEESPALSGRVTSSGYENAALGISLSFSSPWQSVSAIPHRQETDEERDGFLFSIQKPIDADGSGPVLTGFIEHLQANTAEAHMRQFVERRQASRPDQQIGEVRVGEISGREFSMVGIAGQSSIAYYVTIHKGYAISFIGIYGNSVEFDEIRRIINSIRFS